MKGLWFRNLKASEILAAMAVIGSVLGAVGYRQYSYADLDARINLNARRIDSLSDRLKFTNYMQCVQLRKTDPMSLPPDCTPIMERGGKP